jgi:hypothetical protein
VRHDAILDTVFSSAAVSGWDVDDGHAGAASLLTMIGLPLLIARRSRRW